MYWRNTNKTIFKLTKGVRVKDKVLKNESLFMKDIESISFHVTLFDQFTDRTLVLICAQNMNFLILDLDSVFNLSRCG